MSENRLFVVNITTVPRSMDVEVAAATPQAAVALALKSQCGGERWRANWVEDPNTEESQEVFGQCEACDVVRLEDDEGWASSEDGVMVCPACLAADAEDLAADPTSAEFRESPLTIDPPGTPEEARS